MMLRSVPFFFILFSLLAMPKAQALTQGDLAPYLEQFRSGDPNMRRAAADALAKEGSSVLPVLLETLDKERTGSRDWTPQQGFVVRGILLTFVKIGDSSVIPSVFKLLDEPDAEVVGFVTQTICRVSDGKKDVIHELLKVMSEENRIIREITEKRLDPSQEAQLTAAHVGKGMGMTSGLEEAREYAIPGLIDAINDPDPGIRLLSLELLRNMVDSVIPADRQRIIGQIQQLSSDESTEVRDAAKELLRVMGY